MKESLPDRAQKLSHNAKSVQDRHVARSPVKLFRQPHRQLSAGGGELCTLRTFFFLAEMGEKFSRKKNACTFVA
jgi:hypothetical protein